MCYKSNDIKYHAVSVMSEWVSEWVSECCLTPTQLYHAENKLIFNEINDDEWWGPLLCWTNTLSLIFIVLAQWNNSPRIDMSPQSDTYPNSVWALSPECCVLNGKVTNNNFIVFVLTGALTHDLLHSWRALSPLHHRCG